MVNSDEGDEKRKRGRKGGFRIVNGDEGDERGRRGRKGEVCYGEW